MELLLGLESSITRGWNRGYMFCKYGNFEFFFDLHCNHWPFASMSCNVLIMDVVWSFCYICKCQATARRENEKIRVMRVGWEGERKTFCIIEMFAEKFAKISSESMSLP